MSIRDQILNADDIKKESVEVPEWGVTLEVRGMSGGDRARILETAVDAMGNLSLQVVYPEIVIATTYDPATGERIFDYGDTEAILAKNALAVDRIASVGMRLSGLGDAGVADAGKASPSTKKGASTSS